MKRMVGCALFLVLLGALACSDDEPRPDNHPNCEEKGDCEEPAPCEKECSRVASECALEGFEGCEAKCVEHGAADCLHGAGCELEKLLACVGEGGDLCSDCNAAMCQECVEGVCQSLCDPMKCEICEEGTCASACTDLEACVEGECVPKTSCEEDHDCYGEVAYCASEVCESARSLGCEPGVADTWTSGGPVIYDLKQVEAEPGKTLCRDCSDGTLGCVFSYSYYDPDDDFDGGFMRGQIVASSEPPGDAGAGFSPKKGMATFMHCVPEGDFTLELYVKDGLGKTSNKVCTTGRAARTK